MDLTNLHFIDLIRNHLWGVQAIIAKRIEDNKFVVVAQAINQDNGGSISKQFEFDAQADAVVHVKTILGFD